MLRVEEVASKVGVSLYTIENWYKFKKIEPEDELAKLLPEYVQESPTSPRFWKESDIKSIKEFKKKRILGRYGKMAKVTQKYTKKEK